MKAETCVRIKKQNSWKPKENETRECNRCHQNDEIQSDIENWFAVKLDGNVCEILENIVIRLAEKGRILSKAYNASAQINVHIVLHDTQYNSNWPKCSQFSDFFCFYTLLVKERGKVIKGWPLSYKPCWIVPLPIARRECLVCLVKWMDWLL